MPRENTYLSIILKKQAFKEADELITVYTKETGKLRVLAKSVKFSKSKLQHGLQVLFLVKISLVGSKLPRVIGTQVVASFPNIRENLRAAKMAFYALELALKFTADEHKNEKLFGLLEEFLNFLDAHAQDSRLLECGLAKFKIEFLDAVGFRISADRPKDFSGDIGFSNSRGGFVFGGRADDYQNLTIPAYEQFHALRAADFEGLAAFGRPMGNLGELQGILSDFLQYHLERDIKSERFLGQ